MNTHKDIGISQVEEITPDIAKKYLSNMVKNRTLDLARVGRYARAMKENDWSIGDPIKFLEDGRLYDGQHRLSGIVESGCTVKMVVIRNMPLEAMYVADRGKSRTLYNVAQIRGSDVTPKKLSVINYLGFYDKVKSVTRNDNECLYLYEKYKEGIDFSVKGSNVEGAYLRRSIFFAIICKAYYYEHDLERLYHFMQVCYTGLNGVPQDDDSALVLRKAFEYARNKNQIHAGTKQEWMRKIAGALQSFMRYESKKKLYELTYDPYPLPDFSDMKDEQNQKFLERIIKERFPY